MPRTSPNAAKARQARMVELLMKLSVGQGVRPSALAGVKLMRSDEHHPRTPVLYEPSIVVIAQGYKCGYVGGRALPYDPDHYLALTVPLPFECETHPAGPRRPMLGVSVGVDLATLGEVLLTSGDRRRPPAEAAVRAIYSAPLDDRLGDAAVRLLECLDAPGEAAVLGPQVVREILYRVLHGPHGDGLRALAATHGRLAQIAPTLERMHARPADPVDVASLAEEAAMSSSAFHQHFRAVTATSPLAYLKSVRLHKARLLMAYDGLGAAEAAARVGYESASQFSREYRRLFGEPPARDVGRLRGEFAA